MLRSADVTDGQAGFRCRRTLDESPEVIREVRFAIARAKEGDRDALRLLYVRYSDNVYGYVRSIVRDDREAEDLTQQVFMKLITVIVKYEDHGVPFSGWLLRLARNVALDHLRRRRPTPTEEVFGADGHDDDEAREPRARPSRRPRVAARRAAQRDDHASCRRALAAGDRRADGAIGELDPRPAPSRTTRAPAGAEPAWFGAVDKPERSSERGMLSARPASPAEAEAPVPFTRLDFADPELLEELMGAVRGVAERGAFTLGEPVEAFEREFAAYCETDFAVGVSSGTEALALALRALEIGPGDEVIVPTNSFIATAEAVSAVGATPRLVDVDPDSHLITAEIVAENLGPHVRCVIPVHLFGATVDLEPILELTHASGRPRDRGRLPGARSALPRTASGHARRVRLLQLLSDQEPRRVGRRGSGRHLGPRAGRPCAAAARARGAPTLPPSHRRHHGAPGRAAGRRAAAQAHSARRLERRAPAARRGAAERAGRARGGQLRGRDRAYERSASRTATTSITCSSCAATVATSCASTCRGAGSPRRSTTRRRST